MYFIFNLHNKTIQLIYHFIYYRASSHRILISKKSENTWYLKMKSDRLSYRGMKKYWKYHKKWKSFKTKRINSTFYFITAIICLFRNAMQGFGDTKTPILSSLLELLTKLLIAFFLAPKIGYFGIIISEPIAWAIMVIPLIVNMLRWERMHRGRS